MIYKLGNFTFIVIIT